MGIVSGFVEGLAQDYAVDTALEKWNEFAGRHVKVKDPYRCETADGGTRKLRLADNATAEEQKAWRWVQRRAWLDDKCFLGCYPVDCGVGLGPLVVLVPAVGPLLMYAVHAKLVERATRAYGLDAATQAKLHANIVLDLLLSLPPGVGALFAWLSGCSTRNAALVHNAVSAQLRRRAAGVDASAGPGPGPGAHPYTAEPPLPPRAHVR